MRNGAVSERALILAPLGRDALVAGRMLEEAGIGSHACGDLTELLAELEAGAGFALVTEEALVNADLHPISAWIEAQPEWSDFPFVLLTRSGGGLERNPLASRLLRTLGNVTVIERPFHPTILISLVEAALRGRRLQYEARARLEMLRDSERQFRTLADSIPTLCWTANPDGYINWYNQRWYEFTGTAPEDMEGWGWQSVHDPNVLGSVMERWTNAIATGEMFEMVFPLRGADGLFRPFLTRVQPVRDEAGAVAGWFGTNTDISHQRDAEEVLRRHADDLELRVEERTREREAALAQLHEAQKLESIGQLTGGVAHDFNNLLTPVIGNLELLRMRVTGDARAERNIASALQAAGRAATLVQRLLAFARRQDLQPRPVDVGALIHGIHDLISRTIGPGIEVRVEVEEGAPPALIDPNQLELAILNLSINARDAMPEGGWLEIALAVGGTPPVGAGGGTPPAGLGGGTPPDGLSAGGFVVVSVADTGMGMDEATARRAIEPFFSTKEPGKGTGLGLSMVHGLVAQSGGLFTLDSEVGVGTTVRLWLPRSQEAVAVEAAGWAAAPREIVRTTRSATVLLVDDEDLVREGTSQLLSELGYTVVTAASGAEALAQLRGGTGFDILVTDFLMPQMNGAQLSAEARKLKPGLPVLLITGYSNIEQGPGSELARLAKPFRHADLAHKMSELVGAAA